MLISQVHSVLLSRVCARACVPKQKINQFVCVCLYIYIYKQKINKFFIILSFSLLKVSLD